MDTPSWRQIVGGTAGVALLGAIGYFGQARVRTDSGPQKFVSSQTKSAKKPSVPDSSRAGNNEPAPRDEDGDFSAPSTAKSIKVDVSGEVEKPGVYELSEGQRVEDLIKLAGGLKKSADRNRINFAMKLKDEAKVVVPSKTPSPRMAPAVSYPSTSIEPAPISGEIPDSQPSEFEVGITPFRSPSVKKGPSSTRKQPPSSPVSINSANETQLQAVPGIGPAIAKGITDYREANGPFATIEDLKKVKGMGGKTFEKIRQWITL